MIPKLMHYYYGQPTSFGEKKKKLKTFVCINLRIGQYRIFRLLDFCEFGQNSRKFLLLKLHLHLIDFWQPPEKMI